MGLFNKKGSIKIKDKIWIKKESKLQAFISEWQKDPTTIFIFWFDDSLREAELFFSKETPEIPLLLTAREATVQYVSGKKIIIGEHYPLQEKENGLFQKLKLDSIEIWSALDEPLFKQFGSDKIIALVTQLGMKENESIENPMITKAIQNAQAKISKKNLMDSLSSSQSDWLLKNFQS